MSIFRKTPPVFSAPITRIDEHYVLSGSFYPIHEPPFHASVPDRHFVLRMQTYPTTFTTDSGERIHVKAEWHHHDNDANVMVLKCTQAVSLDLDTLNNEVFTSSINELLLKHSRLMVTIHDALTTVVA